MEYTYWDKDIIPDKTVVYGFRADVNSTFTKVFVSSKVKKFIVVEASNGYKYFHNVLKNGKIGSITGSLYYYSLYEDEQEALDAFEIKKQKVRDQILEKRTKLASLLQLIT